MAPPSKDVAPDVNAKWIALRQKHQEDSKKFHQEVVKNREEFDARVKKAHVALLNKHMTEEREFWAKNANGSRAAKSATPISKAARTQTPASARASTVATKKLSTPAASVPSSHPAVPRFEVDSPVTPSKASQTVKSSNPPPTPTKPTRQPPQKGGKPLIIDLCGDSDDEKPSPSKKTPAAPNTTSPSPVQQQPVEVVQDLIPEDRMSLGQGHTRMGSAMPEATLELFGGGASTRSFTTLTPQIKKESDLQDSPQLDNSFRFPSMPSAKETHGVLSVSPSSPFSQRASTAAPQSAQSAFSTPPASEYGPRHDNGLKAPSTSFTQRAIGAVLASTQPLASNGFVSSMNHCQTGDFSFGRTSSLGGFVQRTGLAAPSSPGFGFPNQSHSRSSSMHISEQDELLRNHSSGLGPRNDGFLSKDRIMLLDKAHQIVDGGIANNHQTERGGVLEQRAHNAPRADVDITNTASTNRNNPLPVKSQAAPMSTLRTGDTSSPATYRRDAVQESASAAISAEPPVPPQQRWSQQLPSPPPSHASVVSEPTTPIPPQASTAASTFKKPFLPASAEANKTHHQAIDPEARHVRAGTVGSRASSFTLAAEVRTQRGPSVSSRASSMSGHTGVTASRKRKPTFDLSDEEDVSDYAPSEPDSPLAGKPTRPAGGPFVKKSKASNGSSVASNVSSCVGQPVRKNTFGFKTTTLSKPKLPTTSTTTTGTPRKTPGPAVSAPSSKSLASRPASSAGRQPILARPPASAQVKPKKPQPHTSNSYFGKRAAALKAKDAIRDQYQDTEEFATECAIEAADQLEDARLPEDMGRMSITPSPQDAETVDTLVAPPNKDRLRYQAAVVDEDDSEADINYDIMSDKSWRARR